MRKVIKDFEISEAGIRDIKGNKQKLTIMSEKYTVFGVKCGETITEEKLIEILKKGIRKSIRNYMKNGKIGGKSITEFAVGDYTMKTPYMFSGITDSEIKWRTKLYRIYKKENIEKGKPLDKWDVSIYLCFKPRWYPDFLNEHSDEIKKDIISMVGNHPNIEISVSNPYLGYYKRDEVRKVQINLHIAYDPADIE